MPPKYLKKSEISKMIDSKIDEKSETKTFYSETELQTMSRGSQLIQPTFLPLACRPQQGVGRISRLGDSCEAISGKVDLYITMRDRADSTNVDRPQRVRVLVISQKDSVEDPVAAGTNPSAIELEELFWAGSNNVGLEANMLDMFRNVNRQKWTVHEDFQFTLGYQATYDPLNTTEVRPELNQIYGSTFESTKRLTIKAPKSCLGKLEYPPGFSSNTPNKKAWIVIQHVPVDGSTALPGTVGSALSMSQSTMFRFKDM